MKTLKTFLKTTDTKESVKLDEATVSRSDFDKLKKGSKIEITYGSSISSSQTRTFQVKSKTRSAKHNVDKVNMVDPNKPGGMKFHLYSRDGKDATLALGDMGATIKSYKILSESVDLDEAVDYFKVAKAFDDYAKKHGGIDKKDFERVGQFVRQLGKESDVNKQDKTFMAMQKFIRGMDTDPRDGVHQIFQKHGMWKGGRVMRESVDLEESEFAGWIAMYGGKKVEIKKGEAKDLYGAKMKAAQMLKVPKSKMGLLAIKPAVNESVDLDEGYDEVSMAIRQLHFIQYAAEEISDYLEMSGDMEEWYQNKLANAHSMMQTLHSYAEGDKRMTSYDDPYGAFGEEVEQVTEATSIRVDIPYFDDEPARAKKVQRKYRVKVVDKGRDYQITGDKKNIIKFLMDKDALEWDKGEIEDEFPELFESVVQVDEVKRNAGQSATGYDIYHKTYSDALQHAYAHAEKKHKVKVDMDAVHDKVAMGPKKPSSGKTNSFILPTNTKKNLHVQVYNTGKSYELNMYVESIEEAFLRTLAEENQSLEEHQIKQKLDEAPKVPAGMKFMIGHVYKGTSHTYYRKGNKMTDPVVVHINDKPWKEFSSLPKAKVAAIAHIKSMKESVELDEKAVSKSQQKLMGMALAYKRGEMDDASDEVKKIASSMSEKDLEDFAKTKHKGLPTKVED